MKEPTFSPRSDPTAPGFTLIELLVVIAIIAILAGMLLSAVGQLAHKAQAIGCLGNYRQLQLAWGMYTDDFAGHLPRNEAQARGSYPGSALIPGAKVAPDLGLWNCDAAANRYDSSLGSWVLGNTCWDPDDTGIKQGTLWPHVGSGERIYRCPADRSMVQGQPQLPRRRSVSMSSYMNSYPGNENRHYFWAWHKFHDITQPAPSDAVVFVDEHLKQHQRRILSDRPHQSPRGLRGLGLVRRSRASPWHGMYRELCGWARSGLAHGRANYRQDRNAGPVWQRPGSTPLLSSHPLEAADQAMNRGLTQEYNQTPTA